MKIYELIASLSRSEIRDFRAVIQNHKRAALPKLFAFLSAAATKPDSEKRDTGKQPPTKPELFAALYDGAWEKAKDYLLRNELRLLSDALTDFLALRKFEKMMQADPALKDRYLMEVYREKGLAKQLETRFKKGLSASKAAQRYTEATTYIGIYQDHVLGSSEIHPGTLEKLISMQQEYLQFVQLAFVEDVRGMEAKMAGAYRILSISRPGLVPPSPLARPDLDAPELNSAQSRYLCAIAAAYHIRGQPRIEMLRRALAHTQAVPGSRKTDNELVVLGSIALEYFLLGQYSEADHWYERLESTAREHKRPLRIEMVFNYVSNLIKLEHYAKAVEIFERYEAAAQANMRVYYRFLCLAGMAHVFLDQPREAMAHIPPDIHQRPETQYNYFRFILLFIFYLRGDHEDTLREIRNFEQALSHRSQHEVDIRPMLRFFREFVQLQQALPETRKKRLPSLHERIKEFAATLPPMLGDFLPFLWFRKKIEAAM